MTMGVLNWTKRISREWLLSSVHARSYRRTMSQTAPDLLPVTDRTKVRRHPERGVFDRAALYAILD